MANRIAGEFFSNDENQFNSILQAPIAGTQNAEDNSDSLVTAIIGRIARDAAGIAKCINGTLELDADSYSIYVSGTPVCSTTLGGGVIGYSIHLSIYKPLEPTKPKTPRRVGKSPRSVY
jgi:hypothetical protein